MKSTLLTALLLSLFIPLGCQQDKPTLEADPPRHEVTAKDTAPEIEAKDSEAAPPPVAPPSSSAPLESERNTIDVFQTAAPATVFVVQTQLVRQPYSRPQEVPAGSGTGFIWDKKGHIITNFHVVDGGQNFTVTLYNQKSYPATYVGGEPRRDIAVLKIDAPEDELSPVSLPKDDYALAVGQKAIAIGNPFGLDHTLTVGVISALGREVMGYGKVTIPDMVQTDASINPGNSGGPLLDSSAQLIGMNTMIFSTSGASDGIGFAVPVNTIRRLVPQIIETGKAKQVGLGVTILTDDVARRAGITGVIIERISPDSPAEKAGLQGLQMTKHGVTLGDVIVGIDDDKIENYDDLYNALDRHAEGDKVTLHIVRSTGEVEIEVTLRVLQ